MKEKIILTIKEETNTTYFGNEKNEITFRFYDTVSMKQYIEKDITETIKCFDLTETGIVTKAIPENGKVHLIIRNDTTDLTKIYTWEKL